jgi:dienelactone hydrolase
MRVIITLALGLLLVASAVAQPRQHLVRALDEELQSRTATTLQLGRYLVQRIPRLPRPASAAEWTRQAGEQRRRLRDVALRGWPRVWIDAPAHAEEVGTVESPPAYRVRKVRYDIVPGLRGVGVVCEPTERAGRVPAVVNFTGHDAAGKAADNVQRRCIGLARMGIVAFTPEWLGFGDLAAPHNGHDFGAHLDLVGANALGLFYLSMRRALDYVAALPYVDATRLGVTGLSGGGWQSIVLGALDARVAVAVEVAGIGSLETTITHPADTEEIEENAADLARGGDYPRLVALRAPRPTLLIHNAEDECCFRAPLVKPAIYDRVTPFFRLYGRSGNLRWHENVDPGTHNYEADNRRTAYRFFAEHFRLPPPGAESIADSEIREQSDLAVGVPEGNDTILGVARRLAGRVHRVAVPRAPQARETWRAAQRARLIETLRYRPSAVARAWPLWNSRGDGVTTVSYRLALGNGLGAVAVWLTPEAPRPDAPVAIVLHDGGRKEAGSVVAERLKRGEHVLALDLLFFGEMVPEMPAPPDAEFGVSAAARPQRAVANYQMLLATVGDRPLGLQAAQLLGVRRWARTLAGPRPVVVDTTGMRSQLVALAAAALQPRAFGALHSRDALSSLTTLLDAPVAFVSAPELFCLGLYRDFDVERLAVMAAPTTITTSSSSR